MSQISITQMNKIIIDTIKKWDKLDPVDININGTN